VDSVRARASAAPGLVWGTREPGESHDSPGCCASTACGGAPAETIALQAAVRNAPVIVTARTASAIDREPCRGFSHDSHGRAGETTRPAFDATAIATGGSRRNGLKAKLPSG